MSITSAETVTISDSDQPGASEAKPLDIESDDSTAIYVIADEVCTASIITNNLTQTVVMCMCDYKFTCDM